MDQTTGTTGTALLLTGACVSRDDDDNDDDDDDTDAVPAPVALVQGATRDDDDDEDDDDEEPACKGDEDEDERAGAEESTGTLDDDVVGFSDSAIGGLRRAGRGFSLKFKHLCAYSGSGVTRSARRW